MEKYIQAFERLNTVYTKYCDGFKKLNQEFKDAHKKLKDELYFDSESERWREAVDPLKDICAEIGAKIKDKTATVNDLDTLIEISDLFIKYSNANSRNAISCWKKINKSAREKKREEDDKRV